MKRVITPNTYLKSILITIALCFIFLCTSDVSMAKKLDVTWNKGLLSVDLEDVGAKEVLDKIKEVMYIDIQVGEGIEKRIKKFRAKDEKVKELLKKMLGGKGFAILIEYQAGLVKKVRIAKKEGKSAIERNDLKLAPPKKMKEFRFRRKGKFGYKKAEKITNALLDESKKYKWDKLANKLIEFTKPEFKPLLKKLMDHKKDYIRWEATDAFARLVDEKDADFIIEMAKNDDWSIRSAAAYTAMTIVYDPRFVPVLLDMLNDKEVPVRAYAARMLGFMRLKEAVPYLKPMLKDKRVNARAAEALKQITGKEYDWLTGTDRAMDELDPDYIIGLLDHKYDGFRSFAVNAMAYSDDPRFNNILLNIVSNESENNKNLRNNAVRVLGKRKVQKAIPLLKKILKKKDNVLLKLDAEEALGHIIK